MYIPVYTRQFENDLKRCHRRGKDLEKFKSLARTLLSGRRLDPIHRDHKLVGSYIGRRNCHIEADWVLIYKVEEPRLIFERGPIPTSSRSRRPVAGTVARCGEELVHAEGCTPIKA